jgi:23S rRNA (uracil1939-C5)-methyltransferase
VKNIIAKIIDIGCNGEGIAKDDDKVIFIPYALKEETVEVEIINSKPKFSNAKILKIVEKSKDRITAPCPYFSICGGCQLQHTNYENQLKIKTEIVRNNLNKIAKINFKINDCIASINQFNYRNKMTVPFGEKIGMFTENSHNIIPINNCLIQKEWAEKVIKIFNQFIIENKVSHYDEKTNSGLLKYLVVREIDNNFLFTIVINGEKLPEIENLLQLLSKNFKNFGLYININTKKDAEILSDNFVHIFGLKTLSGEDFGIKYEIGPYSFMQINDEIKKLIYQKVRDEISKEVVVDAYSGAGLLSAILSKKADKVYGIEINKEASKSANDLAKKNNIKNLINLNGDCKKLLPDLVKNLKDFTIVLDPPRAGCDKEVVDAIINSKPNKLIYISCNPSTLARDLKSILQTENYEIKYIQPYDMFPQTKHIETVVCLNRI